MYFNLFIFHTYSYAEDYSTVSVTNTLVAGTSTSSTGARSESRTFIELYFPLLPILLLILVFSAWATWSPSNVVEKDPRIFVLTVGIVFSNAAVSYSLSPSLSLPIIFMIIISGPYMSVPVILCTIMYTYMYSICSVLDIHVLVHSVVVDVGNESKQVVRKNNKEGRGR